MGLNASRHTRHTTQPNIYLATLLSQSVHPHPRSTLPTRSNQSISPSQAPIGFYLVVWLVISSRRLIASLLPSTWSLSSGE
ncbi:hypothetical protein PGTUg99_027722 [Puccinia graminis f. sp. tritici]|uniref:Uncharacterized protein n=1 Tax=Puccinia graminis f. sp. tritici TaxID=56615 RepID=A0A5B0RL50_PUCGR|nr:hypothetical protein PGTUg99_027722 [Puccinia graminis f. sp. tritici]